MIGFEQLEVWQDSCRLAVEIYQILRKCNDYGLRDQMQRAAVSIPSNIAEGSERQSKREFVQFLHVAKGSCAELRTQLYIAARIGMIDNGVCSGLTAHCKSLSRQLQALISSIQPEK